MPARDLPLLIDAARAAGETATSFIGATVKRWDKPEDAGPVTEADLAVNDVLEAKLRSARPAYGWLSEESAHDPLRAAAPRTFIIDPIDGTRSFIDGSRAWAHALAVVDEGQVTAAVVYLPMLDLMYAAAAGMGATLNGVPIHASVTDSVEGATLLAARPMLEARHWRGVVPAFKREHRPSLAYRLSLVAEGRFDAMLTLRKTWEWDVAAGDLILREAGAISTDRRGQLLRFNNAVPQVDGMVAAGPLLHRQMIGALA
ncbi:3'(2'),5'-bisphosphate nucleotidase CysQ [Pelagivirga sediminicola]|uniref:3'(2'),5'-bisphosphate nucleotidase CysQ n=1 Tax=Pelagivirga sediminicola TaxID=2170575 RepID=A0A2T7G5C7_9RHOB|nr:3'(2'),5'-bisphosphate nucleotidase CysQ [Pelagivirga sediminicola]PVA09615.1 3'(2'),5'-bisphosphate nucleotidase CysQ [Pelagivirga sediminicola]